MEFRSLFRRLDVALCSAGRGTRHSGRSVGFVETRQAAGRALPSRRIRATLRLFIPAQRITPRVMVLGMTVQEGRAFRYLGSLKPDGAASPTIYSPIPIMLGREGACRISFSRVGERLVFAHVETIFRLAVCCGAFVCRVVGGGGPEKEDSLFHQVERV